MSMSGFSDEETLRKMLRIMVEEWLKGLQIYEAIKKYEERPPPPPPVMTARPVRKRRKFVVMKFSLYSPHETDEPIRLERLEKMVNEEDYTIYWVGYQPERDLLVVLLMKDEEVEEE